MDDNFSKTNLDSFESWRTLVESRIKDFILTLPAQVQERMDFSVASLRTLETWMLQQYPPLDTDNPKRKIHDGLLYYIGETFRKQLGGYWNVHFKESEPDYMYGEEPVIEGYYKDSAASPYWITMACLDQYRNGQYLWDVLMGLVRLYKPKQVKE